MVTRVRPTLDWGMVRITVESQDDLSTSDMPNGTFCYLADDVLEVEASAPAEVAAHGSYQR